MALFASKESKEERKEAKAKALMNKYGLEDLEPEYFEAVSNINLELAGTSAMEFGSLLSGAKSEDVTKMAFLNALVQQNWIIIRQLDEISKKLDK